MFKKLYLLCVYLLMASSVFATEYVIYVEQDSIIATASKDNRIANGNTAVNKNTKTNAETQSLSSGEKQIPNTQEVNQAPSNKQVEENNNKGIYSFLKLDNIILLVLAFLAILALFIIWLKLSNNPKYNRFFKRKKVNVSINKGEYDVGAIEGTYKGTKTINGGQQSQVSFSYSKPIGNPGIKIPPSGGRGSERISASDLSAIKKDLLQEITNELNKKFGDLKLSFNSELSRVQNNLRSDLKNALDEKKRASVSDDVIAKKESQIRDLTAQINTLKKETARLNGNLNQIQSENARLESEKINIGKKLETELAEVSKKNKIIIEKDAKISELAEQNNKDKEKIEKSEKEIAKLSRIKELFASKFKSYLPEGLSISEGKNYAGEAFDELFVDDSPKSEAQTRETLIIISNLIVLNASKTIDDREAMKNSLLAIGKAVVKLYKLKNPEAGSTFSYLKTWIESLNNGILSDTNFRLKIPMERQSFDSSTMIHESGNGSNVRDISVWGIYQKDERNNLSCQVKARVIC